MENAISNLETVTSFVGLFQSNAINKKSIELNKLIFEKLFEQSRELHEISITESKRTFLINTIQNTLQHFQQLNSDLINSTKECERDMIEVKSQRFQSIILAASVMFGALCSAIVDGNLPSNAHRYFVLFYAITTTLSFSFLFLSVVLSIELVIRVYRFMYEISKNQTKNVNDAIEQSKNIIDSFKDEINKINKSSQEKFQNFTQSSPELIDKFFLHHEYIQDKLLDQRSKIIESLGRIKNSDYTFEKFWDQTCKKWGEIAIFSFYLGTLSLLISIGIFMFSVFYYDFNSKYASYSSIIILFVGLIIIIIVKKSLFRQGMLISEPDYSYYNNYYDNNNYDNKKSRIDRQNSIPRNSNEIKLADCV